MSLENESLEKGIVFIVDNDKISVTDLNKILTLAGYQVYTFYNALEAVSLIEKGLHPDVLFIGTLNSNLGSLETIRIIRQHDNMNRINIVYMSSSLDIADNVRLLTLNCDFRKGVDDFIIKPVIYNSVLYQKKAQIYCELASLRRIQKNTELLEEENSSLKQEIVNLLEEREKNLELMEVLRKENRQAFRKTSGL